MGSTVNSAPIIQSVTVTPDYVVDPLGFFKNTRRGRWPMQAGKAIAGIGSADSIQLKQAGIVAGLEVRLYGTVVVGGTIGTTTASYEWPANFVKNFSLSANGQSQLIAARGLAIKALEYAGNTDLNDRGVARTWAGGTNNAATQGTLSLTTDLWGDLTASNFIAPGSNVAAIGTYPVDITYFIPVAADQKTLIGSVFAQSSATNFNLGVQYATQADLFSAVGASATISFAAMNLQVTGLVYSIPNVNGKNLIPDLSQYHGFTETQTSGLAQNLNEYQLPGVGTGRSLMRVFFQTYSNSVPLAMTDTNYNAIAWAFGGATVPEQWPGGTTFQALNERQTGCALGKLWGLGLHDFVSEHALRDIVDEGSAANLRIQFGLAASPTNGYAKVAQENLFAASIGA